jgi:GIY-YIG catalytic domain
MCGAAGSVLYVGKAKNLRHRLGSYRVANPDRMPRRILRLLGQVTTIICEECRDEAAALRREAELLREIKPRFNRAGVWQSPKKYLLWGPHPKGLELSVAESTESYLNAAGAFGAQASHLHRALIRLLWCRLYLSAGLARMPSGWFHGSHGKRVVIPYPNDSEISKASEQLMALAKGDCEGFSQWMGSPIHSFEKPIHDGDLELVTERLAGRFIRVAAPFGVHACQQDAHDFKLST